MNLHFVNCVPPRNAFILRIPKTESKPPSSIKWNQFSKPSFHNILSIPETIMKQLDNNYKDSKIPYIKISQFY